MRWQSRPDPSRRPRAVRRTRESVPRHPLPQLGDRSTRAERRFRSLRVERRAGRIEGHHGHSPQGTSTGRRAIPPEESFLTGVGPTLLERFLAFDENQMRFTRSRSSSLKRAGITASESSQAGAWEPDAVWEPDRRLKLGNRTIGGYEARWRSHLKSAQGGGTFGETAYRRRLAASGAEPSPLPSSEPFCSGRRCLLQFPPWRRRSHRFLGSFSSAWRRCPAKHPLPDAPGRPAFFLVCDVALDSHAPSGHQHRMGRARATWPSICRFMSGLPRRGPPRLECLRRDRRADRLDRPGTAREHVLGGFTMASLGHTRYRFGQS